MEAKTTLICNEDHGSIGDIEGQTWSENILYKCQQKTQEIICRLITDLITDEILCDHCHQKISYMAWENLDRVRNIQSCGPKSLNRATHCRADFPISEKYRPKVLLRGYNFEVGRNSIYLEIEVENQSRN